MSTEAAANKGGDADLDAMRPESRVDWVCARHAAAGRFL